MKNELLINYTECVFFVNNSNLEKEGEKCRAVDVQLADQKNCQVNKKPYDFLLNVVGPGSNLISPLVFLASVLWTDHSAVLTFFSCLQMDGTRHLHLNNFPHESGHGPVTSFFGKHGVMRGVGTQDTCIGDFWGVLHCWTETCHFS